MPTARSSSIQRLMLKVLTLALALWCAEAKAAGEIIVDNIRSASGLTYRIDGGVFAFRNLTNSSFSEVGTGPIETPRNVIVKSVLSFDEINQAFVRSGLNQTTVTPNQLQELIAKTTYDETYLFDAYSSQTASLDKISSVSKPIPLPGQCSAQRLGWGGICYVDI